MAKMSLEEATLKALYDQLEDNREVDDVQGLVDDILIVTDPGINEEQFEEVIERAQEIVEDTPEGEIPFDEEWVGQYLQTCPICGATFVTDEILEPGAICPVCTQVPEAFVMVGKVQTEEKVAEENGINTEEESEEETRALPNLSISDEEPEEETDMERDVASKDIPKGNILTESKDYKARIADAQKWLEEIDNANEAEDLEAIVNNALASVDDIKDTTVAGEDLVSGLANVLDDSDAMNQGANTYFKSVSLNLKNIIEDYINELEEYKLEESKLEEDRLNFKSVGIIRDPSLDFSDDGNRFKGYRCNDIPITFLKDNGYVFLSIRPDYLEGLSYKEYSSLPSYKDCDKYNGVDENKVDLKDVVEICKRIKTEYDEALANVKDVSDDDYKNMTDSLYEIKAKEFEEAKNELRKIDQATLIEAPEYQIKRLKDYLKSMKSNMDRWAWENTQKTNQQYRRSDMLPETQEYNKKASWYLKEIKEIVEEILNKKEESLKESKENDIFTIVVDSNNKIANKAKEFGLKVYGYGNPETGPQSSDDDYISITGTARDLIKFLEENPVNYSCNKDIFTDLLSNSNYLTNYNNNFSNIKPYWLEDVDRITNYQMTKEQSNELKNTKSREEFINKLKELGLDKAYNEYKNSLNESTLNKTSKWNNNDEDIQMWLEFLKESKESDIKEIMKIINEEKSLKKESTELDDKLQEYTKQYVPSSGEADTVGGEIVRALNKILYRWYNDGDVYCCGYGLETCGNSACYLIDKGFKDLLDKADEIPVNTRGEVINRATYEKLLDDITEQVLDYLDTNSEIFEEVNNEDSINYGDPEEVFEEFCYGEVEYDTQEIDELGLEGDLEMLVMSICRDADIENGIIRHVKMDCVEDLENEIYGMIEQAREEQEEYEDEE